METQTKTLKKYFTCHQTLLCMHQLLIKGKIYFHNRIYNLLQSHDVTYTLMNAIRKRSTCLVDELHQPTIFFLCGLHSPLHTVSPDNSLVLVIKSCKRNFFFIRKISILLMNV